MSYRQNSVYVTLQEALERAVATCDGAVEGEADLKLAGSHGQISAIYGTGEELPRWAWNGYIDGNLIVASRPCDDGMAPFDDVQVMRYSVDRHWPLGTDGEAIKRQSRQPRSDNPTAKEIEAIDNFLRSQQPKTLTALELQGMIQEKFNVTRRAARERTNALEPGWIMERGEHLRKSTSKSAH